MRAGVDGYLRHMGNAEELLGRGEGGELFPQQAGHGAAYARIHLVEDQHGYIVAAGQHGLEAQHHARHLSAGSGQLKRLQRIAGVGGEHEFNGVHAGGREAPLLTEEGALHTFRAFRAPRRT